MSQVSNHEKSKDKKKSFVERFFNFASQTMRINKKSKVKKSSHKKLQESLGDRNKMSKSLLQLEIQTCTFCDYCDGEIVADFTGQNIIYHDTCKNKHKQQFAAESPVELESNCEFLDSIVSEIMPSSNETTGDINGKLTSRLSISLNDISINDMTLNKDVTIILRSDRERSLDVCRQNNYFVDKGTGSYTFSTVDLSTIKQYGISIKKIASIPNDTSPDTSITSFDNDSNKDIYKRRRSSSMTFSNLLPDDLKMMMEVFNDNDQGLFIETKSDQVMGKIRVFINLLRPIKMLLTARPPSTFDIFPDNISYSNQSTIDRAYYNKEVIFWLPRGTTKLLYININCPTTDVISLLLSKFNIQNNPKKFALYEHTIKSPKEVEVSKLRLNQRPLKIMMDWCSKGVDHYHQNLETRRFVLQENDPGSIEWDEFSIPELKSFLMILEQEELEKKKQIVRKFEILRAEIGRRMTIKKNIRQQTDNVLL